MIQVAPAEAYSATKPAGTVSSSGFTTGTHMSKPSVVPRIAARYLLTVLR
jgi:hypothetical protein